MRKWIFTIGLACLSLTPGMTQFWEQEIDLGFERQRVSDLEQDINLGFFAVIIGETDDVVHKILARFDSNGDFTWQQEIDAPSVIDYDRPWKMDRSPTGEILIAGSVNDSALVVQFDSQGNKLWRKAYRQTAATGQDAFSLDINFILNPSLNFSLLWQDGDNLQRLNKLTPTGTINWENTSNPNTSVDYLEVGTSIDEFDNELLYFGGNMDFMDGAILLYFRAASTSTMNVSGYQPIQFQYNTSEANVEHWGIVGGYHNDDNASFNRTGAPNRLNARRV
ncbi:MAG: hypothetical protein AAFV80_23365, partial [Bacteroidota bacterium]